MFFYILINILIILLAIFVPAFIKTIALSKNKAFDNFNTPMEYSPVNSFNKPVQAVIDNAEKILEENNVHDFSIDKFYDNLR